MNGALVMPGLYYWQRPEGYWRGGAYGWTGNPLSWAWASSFSDSFCFSDQFDARPRRER